MHKLSRGGKRRDSLSQIPPVTPVSKKNDSVSCLPCIGTAAVIGAELTSIWVIVEEAEESVHTVAHAGDVITLKQQLRHFCHQPKRKME